MDASSWIAEQRIATLTSGPGLPSVTSTLAGHDVRGPWWQHPLRHRVFAAAQVLHHHPDVLTTRLAGRVTYVHRDLWTVLARVVTDPSFQARAQRHLAPPGPTLLTEVHRLGEARLDHLRGTDRTVLATAARDLLERMLCHGDEVPGLGEPDLVAVISWNHAMPDVIRRAGELAYADALDTLLEACRGQSDALERYG